MLDEWTAPSGVTTVRIDAARDRAARADRRVAQIRGRIAQLKDEGGAADARWRSAADLAHAARTHTKKAAALSAEAFLASAAMHDRVAAFHETADQHESRDGNRRKAAWHRERAERDRSRAKTLSIGTGD